jgi:phage virion morphogenesis protein
VTSSDPLSQVEAWAGALLAKVQPSARRTLAIAIARELRRSQQRRIALQRTPDDSPYASRKPRLRDRNGSIRRRADMFTKLRTARMMRATGTADAAEVGFTGRVARIARIHQEGLRDRAAPNAPEVRYAKRTLLGFTETDLAMIREQLMRYLIDK